MWRYIRRRSRHIHEPNEVRVLRLVRDRGAISRIEIAETTGLHKATVTDLVNNLIMAGFLEEIGEMGSLHRVDRRRRILRFCAKHSGLDKALSPVRLRGEGHCTTVTAAHQQLVSPRFLQRMNA